MAPALTQHDELRRRILSVLATVPSRSLAATEAASTIYEQYVWTADDHEPFPASEGMPKWRKRLQIQRDRMANDGLVERSRDQVWTLTSEGWAQAQQLRTDDDADLQRERERREELWQDLRNEGGPEKVTKALIRDLGFYSGQAGIYANMEATRTAAHPNGIAVTVMHTGKSYSDHLSSDGLMYHYPSTERRGHDQNEVEAARAAFMTAMPLFVITPEPGNLRTVHRGYIEDMDDVNKVLLVTFTNGEMPPPPAQEELESFTITDDDGTATYSLRKNRPNQNRFAFQVFKRYGESCAVCNVSSSELVQAAHLISKKNKGTDDPRNGLPLCANHHLAFDKDLWTIDPDHNLHHKTTGPSLDDLAINRRSLAHLPRHPHPDVLDTIWQHWTKKRTK
ncbi:HNH endonuclease [Arthrobacter sulfonylureivorans]|uniref:HNH endonuclease n=1 Tax=Arthrobacter sulfonylureivorans TaxID=2486855 RepID=A0ABY3WFF0_9MICC|nr:HNH endonuclease [Arthrobacter sulfonylureivorans]UNK47101.1 HNH endonuclease [Arthrobacter sulfonylureivorans]